MGRSKSSPSVALVSGGGDGGGDRVLWLAVGQWVPGGDGATVTVHAPTGVIDIQYVTTNSSTELERGQMDGRMDGRTDEWVDERKDGRTDGWTDERMDGWTKDGRTDGWTDRRIDGWTNGRTNGWTEGRTDGRVDRWTDGRMDGQMDRWIDRWNNHSKMDKGEKRKIESVSINNPSL